MSILIKGMEMSKNCNECKFSTWASLNQTAACKIHNFDPCFKDYSREYMKKRADFCPLVEIPEPHGDLIDRDALLKDAPRYIGLPPRYEPIYINVSDVMKATTVIEAEVDE